LISLLYVSYFDAESESKLFETESLLSTVKIVA